MQHGLTPAEIKNALALSGFGALAGAFIKNAFKDKTGTQGLLKLIEVVIIGAVAGLLALFLSKEFNFSLYMTGATCTVAGLMGRDFLEAVQQTVKDQVTRRIKSDSGIDN